MAKHINPEDLFEALCECGWLQGANDSGYRLQFAGAYSGSVGMPQSDTERPLKTVREGRVVLGLTGNIAVGKSTVLDYLTRLGADVIDADRMVHSLREPGAAGYEAIVAWLGHEILLPDGRIDIARLSSRAFSEPEVLRSLESIFGPLVVDGIAQWIERSDKPVCVVEAIRLLEGDLRHSVDQIWVVDASRETQIARLIAERGMTAAQAVARIESQGLQQEKIAQADVVITNDGALESTYRQVLAAWYQILARLYAMNRLSSQLVSRYCSVCIAENGIFIDADALHDTLVKIAFLTTLNGTITRAQAVTAISRNLA